MALLLLIVFTRLPKDDKRPEADHRFTDVARRTEYAVGAVDSLVTLASGRNIRDETTALCSLNSASL